MTKTPVVLVTGASRGLGRGIAQNCARAGCSIAIHYVGNESAAEANGFPLSGCGKPSGAAVRPSPWQLGNCRGTERFFRTNSLRLRPSGCPGQQRRHGPANTSRHYRNSRGQLRRGHERQSEGALFSFATSRPLLAGAPATKPAGNRLQTHFHHLDLGKYRLRQSGRILPGQSGSGNGRATLGHASGQPRCAGV